MSLLVWKSHADSTFASCSNCSTPAWSSCLIALMWMHHYNTLHVLSFSPGPMNESFILNQFKYRVLQEPCRLTRIERDRQLVSLALICCRFMHMNQADGIHARYSYHHDLSLPCPRPEYLTYILAYIYVLASEWKTLWGSSRRALNGWLAELVCNRIHAMIDTNLRRIVARDGLVPLDWNWPVSLHQSFDLISSRAVLKNAFSRGWMG